MATVDLRAFIESRFRALDPTIDISAGSPAQVQFIEPLITRLGTDPFETDIETFLLDRLKQEFPEIYPGDPSAVRDLLVKPLILFLEPFKREINVIKLNQSLASPELLSDDDVDALAANRFEDRPSGVFAGGTARVYYPNPTNVQVAPSVRFYTTDGMNFFPSGQTSITAEEMTFNRYNALYYMDVPVTAELEGDRYNIDIGKISGVDGLANVSSATNIRKFQYGLPKQSNTDFVNQVRNSLTEQSLVTRPGAAARVRKEFSSDVRAVQVIGAGDPEMERDFLIAATPGHLWVTGVVHLYGNVALVQARAVEGDDSVAPAAGDTLCVYFPPAGYPAIAQASRFVRLKVAELISGPLAMSTGGFQQAYLVRWSGNLPAYADPSTAFEGGFAKKSAVDISSLAGQAQTDLTTLSGDAHMFGHTDIYVRPSRVTSEKAVLQGVSDTDPLVARVTLQTVSGLASVVDPTPFDFLVAGAKAGDLLVIESGPEAGVYHILEVTGGSPSYLYIDTILQVSQTNLRYRIVSQVSVNLFEPWRMKLPFGAVPPTDLITSIGSRLFKLNTNDSLFYGAAVGDTVRIQSGVDKGDFTITGFDPVLGGQGIIMNRPAAGSASGLRYLIFTPQEKVQRPLVRLKDIQLLDTSGQTTGIKIPPADPVAVMPTGDFTSARVKASSLRKSAYILPDMTGYFSGSNIASTPGGLYSLGFEPADGMYKKVTFWGATQTEFLFRTDSTGKCSYIMLTAEQLDETDNYPPADPLPGECLTVKSGPNAGSYVIKAVHKFKYTVAGPLHNWLYFVQIQGTFPVDVLKSLIDFLNASTDMSAHIAPITTQLSGTQFDTFFSTFWSDLGTKLRLALIALGITSPSAADLQAKIDALTITDYDWGDPARGVLRSFFREPVLIEQTTGSADSVTEFKFTSPAGEVTRYRPDPTRYTEDEIVPAKLDTATDPVNYRRDMTISASTTATFADSPTVYQDGVAVGDVLEYHEEVMFHGSYARMSAVRTQAGSAEITAPSASQAPFTANMVGTLLFIEEGDDKGGYRVTKFTDSSHLTLDRVLSTTTPVEVISGYAANWGYDGGLTKNKLVVGSGTPFLIGHVGMYLTLYGIDSAWEGSYKIKSIISTTTVELDRTGNFPAYPADAALGRWVVTAAPVSAPISTANGTELSGLRPFRMYEGQSQKTVISAVTRSTVSSVVTAANTVPDGVAQPFRIYRENIRRITPTLLASRKDGAYYYFDTEVVSLSPNPTANIPATSYLETVEGTFVSFGYRIVPFDRTLTYSTKEEGLLILPNRVLPQDSTYASHNFITVLDARVQILYELAGVVGQLQSFLEEPLDRVTSANMLARHFLPAYVSYDATYTGGAKTSDVAKDVIAAIDAVEVENPVDVSVLEVAIANRGGNPVTPTKVMILTHDWSRKVWLEMSQDQVGGAGAGVPFDGTARVVCYTPGPDVSGKTTLPDGERVNLTRS